MNKLPYKGGYKNVAIYPVRMSFRSVFATFFQNIARLPVPDKHKEGAQCLGYKPGIAPRS